MKIFKPKVSIIIPVYNGSNYLAEAIDSAIAQTYKNIEIIVINDGSNDNGKTDKIAKSYGNKIKYYHKENGGVATALNYGIEKMTGEYFSWLSHDDLYYPDKIEKQIYFLNNLDNRDEIIPYADYDLIDEKNKIIDTVFLDHDILESKPEYALLRGNINGLSLLISSKILKSEKSLFNQKLKCTQDYDLWLRLSKRYKFLHMKEVIVKTRVHKMQDSINHPNAISEGNSLWVSMMESIDESRKIELEGSLAAYYIGMYCHLSNSMYKEATKYALSCIDNEFDRLTSVIPRNKRLISVIIPCFNNATYLNRALESVKIQKYDNYEVIIVNDGSTDDATLNILDRISSEKIKVFHTSNKGVSAARNYGYSKSKGNYIQFLDSDDFLLANKFKFQLAVLMSNASIGLVYSTYKYYNEIESSYEAPHLKVDLGVKTFESLVYGWQRDYSIPIHSPLIKRSCFDNKEKPFEVDFKISEDWIMWISLSLKTKFFYINSPMVIYRIWPNSTTGSSHSGSSSIYWASRSISYIAEKYIKPTDLNRYNIEQQKYLKILCSMYFTDEFSYGYRKMYNDAISKIRSIESSSSWKITKPLRLFSSFIKQSYESGIAYSIKISIRKACIKILEVTN